MGEQGIAEREDQQAQVLDPFAFFRGVASGIGGLGGNAPGHDPAYAFHTDYVPVGRGAARFLVRFTNLQARRGTLVLRVHMLPDEPGAIASLANSERIQFNRLIQLGGEASIDFEGFRGFTFALLGQVPDDRDVRADALTITLDRPGGASAMEPGPAEDIRTTRFTSAAFRPTAQLLALTRPSLAAPVSQPCTIDQMREPAWRPWLTDLGHPLDRDPARWPEVFALQLLLLNNMLQPGACGTLEGMGERMAAVVQARGSTIVPAAADEAGRAPLDFLCSALPLDQGRDLAFMTTGIEATLRRLRPGGLAILFLPLQGPGTPTGFGRADLERLALLLISRRHEVAQLAPSGTTAGGLASVPAFGLVVRRAASLL